MKPTFNCLKKQLRICVWPTYSKIRTHALREETTKKEEREKKLWCANEERETSNVLFSKT